MPKNRRGLLNVIRNKRKQNVEEAAQCTEACIVGARDCRGEKETNQNVEKSINKVSFYCAKF